MSLVFQFFLGALIAAVILLALAAVEDAYTRYRRTLECEGWFIAVEAPGFYYSRLIYERKKRLVNRVAPGHKIRHCNRARFASDDPPLIRIRIGDVE